MFTSFLCSLNSCVHKKTADTKKPFAVVLRNLMRDGKNTHILRKGLHWKQAAMNESVSQEPN